MLMFYLQRRSNHLQIWCACVGFSSFVFGVLAMMSRLVAPASFGLWPLVAAAIGLIGGTTIVAAGVMMHLHTEAETEGELGPVCTECGSRRIV